MDSRLGSAVKNYYEGLAKETDFTEGYEDIRACVKTEHTKIHMWCLPDMG